MKGRAVQGVFLIHPLSQSTPPTLLPVEKLTDFRLGQKERPLSHKMTNRLRFLQGQPLEPCPQETKRLVVLCAQMVAAVLMTELVNNEPIRLFSDTLVEPLVAEAL